MQVATIGIDLAKHVFQVHGVDADGSVVVRRKLRLSEVIRFFVKLSDPTPSCWAKKVTTSDAGISSLPRTLPGNFKYARCTANPNRLASRRRWRINVKSSGESVYCRTIAAGSVGGSNNSARDWGERISCFFIFGPL
jgi:hypothetical protein